jgi:hypothetical protein
LTEPLQLDAAGTIEAKAATPLADLVVSGQSKSR